MPRFSQFIGGSYTAQSLIEGAEETINLYVEKAGGDGATSPSALYPAPGFRAWSTGSSIGGRALVAVGNTRLFAAMGGKLDEFDSSGTKTNRATIAQDSNPAQIIYNGTVANQIGICSGGSVYSYDLATNTLGGPHLSGGYTHLAYAGAIALALNPTTGKVNLSALNDVSSWSAGTFFQRSIFPDPWQAMFVDANNLVWLIGTETFDVRYNSGQGTQPFTNLSGLVGSYGIASSFAFGCSGAGNFWLVRGKHGTGKFVMSNGGTPSVVSNYAFSTAIGSYLRTARLDDCEVMPYEQEGHTFICPSFPSAQAQTPTSPTSWAYDAEGQSWTKRGMWSNGRWALWAPRVHAYAFGKHLVADRTTSTIWEMDPSFATDTDGNGIRRVRRSPHLNNEHKRLPIDQFEILMDVGLGVQSGQGSDPQAMLRVSNDGGRTFGNERRAGTGKIGKWGTRCFWTRLGASPDAVLEVSYTEPIPFRIVDSYINNAEKAA